MIARFAAMSEEERAARHSPIERVAMMAAPQRRKFVALLSSEEREVLTMWEGQARPAQQIPKGDWRTWLMMAGRGFGKTRVGSEWVIEMAESPGMRIALVGPTEDEARSVMIEGSSGLLACAGEDAPLWEPSLGRLTWPNGSRAFIYSAANPESLRGPEHDFAWCDEIAKWPRGEEAWDNLMFGLRRGLLPRVLATTTPRPTPLMRALRERSDVARTRGRTADNALLAQGFLGYVEGLYGGTRLGRQELDGELIEDVEGALWTRDMIEKARVMGRGVKGDSYFQHRGTRPGSAAGESNCPLVRVVIGVDPPASASGDACGIVACGLDGEGVAYVLGDHSVRGRSPDGWARAVADAAELWGADKVVVEANQGGDMVESVLRGADVALPVKSVHARYGKGRRAEPVATWFAKGKAKFLGAFPDLEDELAGLTYGGGYEGPGRSPDRADAMVWAMTELLGGKERPMPRITRL
ncbi:MAG TPA: terminase family protein [Allosphingosinicella sp.]|nr:terminase family protein [Allosphingosinicella sp.]